MAALSKRDATKLVELERMLADIDRKSDAPEIIEHLADTLGVDLTVNLRFEHARKQLLVVDATSGGPQRVTRRDLEHLKRGVGAGEMQFLFSSPVPERAQRNRVALISSIRGAPKLAGRDASRLGLTDDAMEGIRPGIRTLIELYERIGIAAMHNARILVCDGPLLLRYTSMAHSRPFTRRQCMLFARSTEALRRRAMIDHRLGLDTTFQAAFAATLETIGRAAFLVDRHGRVIHANQLGVLALDREHDLAAHLIPEALGQSEQFDVHLLSQRGVSNVFLVIRRCADLGEIAAAFAMEHGFTGRGRDVFVAAAAGESTNHIAARLDIAHNTVEYHLTKVFRAVGVQSRAELQRVLTERLIGRSVTARLPSR